MLLSSPQAHKWKTSCQYNPNELSKPISKVAPITLSQIHFGQRFKHFKYNTEFTGKRLE